MPRKESYLSRYIQKDNKKQSKGPVKQEAMRISQASTQVTHPPPIDNLQSPKFTSEEKDEFGILFKLRQTILKKYQIVEIVGNGSYGIVCKGKC